MSKPLKPQVVARTLGDLLPSDGIITCDSGHAAAWWARYIGAKRGQMHSCSGTLATMACGLPYAIAAQLAYPNRPVTAFIGDGSFSMLMAELATCVKYELPIKIVLLKNNALGAPGFGNDLQPIDFTGFARCCGARGMTLINPEKCSLAVGDALSVQKTPVLLEAIVDPNEIPRAVKHRRDERIKEAI